MTQGLEVVPIVGSPLGQGQDVMNLGGQDGAALLGALRAKRERRQVIIPYPSPVAVVTTL